MTSFRSPTDGACNAIKLSVTGRQTRGKTTHHANPRETIVPNRGKGSCSRRFARCVVSSYQIGYRARARSDSFLSGRRGRHGPSKDTVFAQLPDFNAMPVSKTRLSGICSKKTTTSYELISLHRSCGRYAIISCMVGTVVVDTSVFISALIGAQGPSREILRRCLQGYYHPVMSNTLFLEYEDVSGRDEVLTLCPLAIDEIRTLLNAFYAVCRWVPIYCPNTLVKTMHFREP